VGAPHAAWDLAHHFWGNPILALYADLLVGCMIFDSLIAIWFLAGAPALLRRGVPVLSR
jgi:hypothetical protein